MTRKQRIKKNLSHNSMWDVIVIGGGATGLGILTEASYRGLQSVLFEMGDFASQTSSASTKLIHGGIRYLKDFSIPHLLESAREQQVIKRIAPHLIDSIPFILPCTSRAEHVYFRSGLSLFDILTFFKKNVLTKSVSVKDFELLIPNFNLTRIQSGLLYQDCQFDDARFAISLCKTAEAHGGVPINYCKVTSLLKEGSKVSGVVVKDQLTDEVYECRAKVVINAAGPFIDTIRKLDNSQEGSVIHPTQGIHIVLPVKFLGGKNAFIVPKTSKGKVLYGIPWKDRLLVGTTERVLSSPAEANDTYPEDIAYLLEELGSFLKVKPEKKDILSVFSGVRPLLIPTRQNTKIIPRDHDVFVSKSKLVTVGGGKWTTYRIMARDTLKIAAIIGSLKPDYNKPDEIQMMDFSIDVHPDKNLRVYGKNANVILEMASQSKDLAEYIHPYLPVTYAMIKYAVLHEYAETVEDLLARRTRALYIDAKSTQQAAPKVAKLMAEHMNRDQNWIREQINKFTTTANKFLP